MKFHNDPSGLEWELRPDTTDHNTVYACAVDDEYELAGLDVRDKLIFDIGAHLGGVGVTLASRGARVVCVEPVPENAFILARNFANNGLTPVAIIGAALGTEFVSLGPKGDPHEFIANIGEVSDERRIHVGQTTFSALVHEFGAPDFVKLDCEGGEWACFRDPAIHAVPLIVGEFHDDRAEHSDVTGEDITRLLPGHDVTISGTPMFGAFRAVRR